MIDLKHEVQKRGFTVAHIKTDSIKIPDATPEIIQFVMDFGKKYGYTFEHEATYDRMCLVNDAVYMCKYDDGHWDATGTQFQIPYVFKTLFSKEDIMFEDVCKVINVQKGSLYLDFNEDLNDVIKAFKYFDINHNGRMNISELKRVLSYFGDKMSEDEIINIFRSAGIDHNSDDDIDYMRFIDFWVNNK